MMKLIKKLAKKLKRKCEAEDLERRKREMCVRCINSGNCPSSCSICAWRTGKHDDEHYKLRSMDHRLCCQLRYGTKRGIPSVAARC